MKKKISKIFTKIREAINEREDKLLLEIDNIYENSFFKEELIKKGEKMPNEIKNNLEIGKILNQELDDDNNDKLIKNINDCINIENNIKIIINIKECLEKSNIKYIIILFFPGEEQITKFIESIKKVGEIIYDDYKFRFKQSNNYNVTKNG